MAIRAIIVCHGSYEGTVEFNTVDEIWGYREGLLKGASLFGGDDCDIYTDKPTIDGEEVSPEIKMLIARYLKEPLTECDDDDDTDGIE